MRDDLPPHLVPSFKSRIEPGAGCWLWTGYTNNHGYGMFGWRQDGKNQHTYAHRGSYVLACGPIPDGMTIDHLCRVRHCVNPGHLRVLSPSENYSDNGQKHKTHCPQGHPYGGENLYLRPDGARACRICRVGASRRHRQRKAARLSLARLR